MGAIQSTFIMANFCLESPQDLTVESLENGLVITPEDFTEVETIEFSNTIPMNFMDFIINNNLCDVLDYLFKLEHSKNYKYIMPEHFAKMSSDILMVFINNYHDFKDWQLYELLVNNKNLTVISNFLDYNTPDDTVNYIMKRKSADEQIYLVMLLIYNEYNFNKEDLLLISRNKTLFKLIENNIEDIKKFAAQYIGTYKCVKCDTILNEGGCINCRVDRLLGEFKKIDFESVD